MAVLQTVHCVLPGLSEIRRFPRFGPGCEPCHRFPLFLSLSSVIVLPACKNCVFKNHGKLPSLTLYGFYLGTAAGLWPAVAEHFVKSRQNYDYF